jgi:hypothetical protein
MRYVEKLIIDPLVVEAQAILRTAGHYNESDRVKDIIRIIYSGCCAFCNSTIEHSSFYQIEHFYPKGNPLYSRYIKNIFNLHYGCQRCNTLKGTAVHPFIFSPNYYLSGHTWTLTNPKKIDQELIYVGHIAYSIRNRFGSTDRAQATIDLFDLNDDNGGGRSGRRYLVEERIRTFDQVFELVATIYHLIQEEKISPFIDRAIKLLFTMVVRYVSPRSPYSKMIVQNFGEDIFKLLTIYLKKRRLTL